jgi:hypothetical protein
MSPAITPSEDSSPPSGVRLLPSEAYRAEIGQERIRLQVPVGWSSPKSRSRKRRRLGRGFLRTVGCAAALVLALFLLRYMWM